MSSKATETDATPKPDKFRDLGRELGCGEDEAAFEDQVRRVAKAPRPPEEENPE